MRHFSQATNVRASATAVPETNMRILAPVDLRGTYNTISAPSWAPVVSDDLNSLSHPRFEDKKDKLKESAEEANE